MDAIYLDYNATVPFPESALKDLETALKKGIGNPSSLHAHGRSSRRLINIATEALASFTDCDAEFVYWTSGASEANSWAVHSAIETTVHKKINRKAKVLVSAIEHESVHMAAKYHASRGVEVVEIPVNGQGVADLDFLKNLLERDADWDLISLMHANNETGVIQPVAEMVSLAKRFGIATHVDAVQTLGKIPFSVKKLGATYTTFSAHKVGGFKGVGALVVQGEGRILTPLVHGKQQKSLRGGTENPLGTFVFGKILEKMKSGEIQTPALLQIWRDEFEQKLKAAVPGVHIHGEKAQRLPNTSYVGFEGTDGDGVLVNLDLEGFSASSGSACTSGSIDPSQVLLAMGCDKAIARSSIRISSGRETKQSDYDALLGVLPGIIERVRKKRTYS